MTGWTTWNPARARRVSVWLGLAMTLVLGWTTWLAPSVLVRLDHLALDAQFRLRGERTPSRHVLMVLIDEKSLKEIGRWPWTRDTQARLVDRISAGKPAILGLDVIYAEPEEPREKLAIGRWLEEERRRGTLDGTAYRTLHRRLEAFDGDRAFAQSVARNGSVVLAVPAFVPETGTAAGIAGMPSIAQALEGSEFMVVRHAQPAEAFHPYEAVGFLLPVEPLAGEARGLGHVYRLPDQDGVTRREVLALRYGDAYYPSFALEIARLYLGIPREHMALVLGEGVQLGSVTVPTDQKLRMLIDYAGRDGRVPQISASDVLHGRLDPSVFYGKIVLVGTAALGTYDQLATPYSANVAGVEKNATVIENIVERRFLRTGLWSGPLELGLVVGFGLLLTGMLPRLRAAYAVCVAGGLGLGYAAAAQWVFTTQGTCLPVVMPSAAIGLVFLVTTLLNLVLKEQQTRQIHAMFASYVSPKIVQELVASPALATVGGHRKELTMLFADLVGFTKFSEHRSAERVVEQLNEYLTAMTDVIFRWNGTLDKFVGDAIVVFWGAPTHQPDHAERAVRCALEMQTRMLQLQDHWRQQGKPVLENGIGLNTGMAVVGNIGADGKKMDYTMIGDQVNLAARIQELTRALGQPILLAESTVMKLDTGAIPVRRLQVVTVKGRETPVTLYTIDPRGERAEVRPAIA